MNTARSASCDLPDLQRALTRTHRARLMRRRAIATGAIGLPAIALAFTVFSTSGGGTGFQPVSPTHQTPIALAPPPQPLPLGERMSASSTTGEGHSPLIIESMTDDELLAALAEAGQPSGLITINGKTTVVANTFPKEPSPFAPFGAAINAHHQ